MVLLLERRVALRKLVGTFAQIAAFMLLMACSDGQQTVRTEPQNPGVPPQKNSSATTNTRPPTGNAPAQEEVPIYTYEVVNSWPHNTSSFTQGLVYHDDHLYESTGQYGSSLLCRVDLKSGKIQKKVDVDKEYFAEGMTILGNKVFQLTWQSHRGFVYDLKDFKRQVEFTYDGEGWGLTNDGHLLIMSDGTNQLRFIDPVSFRVQRTIEVYDQGQPLMDLNELEYIKGEIYANIWHSEKIARINPESGKILAWIDLTGLRRPEDGTHSDNVLNGIAYDEKTDRLFVTGKRWSRIYEIRLVKK